VMLEEEKCKMVLITCYIEFDFKETWKQIK